MIITASALRQAAVLCLFGTLTVLGGCFFTQTSVPSDPLVTPSCNISLAEFESWFESGAVSLNGLVKPANSVLFSDPLDNCEFYKWTQQMFLWLTSPAPLKYGGKGLVFDSPLFYDVSPPNANNERFFIPHTSSNPVHKLDRRVAQAGPQGLPLIVENQTGRPLEIAPTLRAANDKPLVLNGQNERVEVHAIRRVDKNRVEFLDANSRRIQRPRAIIDKKFNAETTVQLFSLAKVDVFLDVAGNTIDVEQGQAFGAQVLQAQNSSLVYYLTTVNNVYAYYATALKNGAIASPGGDPAFAKFPTTQAELDAIEAFAAANGKTLVDSEALAIEIKSSWVEAAGLPDLHKFIQMKATIPTYDTSDPDHWIKNGEKTVNMAMVGMHVVGSTKGHPEMLWGTFEHVSNAPNEAYSYVNSSGALVNVPRNTNGNWVFCSSNANDPFNIPHMFAVGHDIKSDKLLNPPSAFSISPSNTIRRKAWGAASDVSPNPLVGSAAESNSQLILINNSARSKLLPGDRRANYIQTGTTWTINGAAPNNTNQVGTNKLANSTMETYQQGNNSLSNGTNCFSCHASNTTSVSRIFDELQPLF